MLLNTSLYQNKYWWMHIIIICRKMWNFHLWAAYFCYIFLNDKAGRLLLRCKICEFLNTFSNFNIDELFKSLLKFQILMYVKFSDYRYIDDHEGDYKNGMYLIILISQVQSVKSIVSRKAINSLFHFINPKT